jgi:aminobenzoyl-glutamate utilization protein B
VAFTGTAAHAANSPHLGRSALDAVTLMTTGSNFLNEHIIEKARVHYAITDTGGVSPNVVQAQAEVLYLIRAPEMADAQQIFARIEKIAQGAALMTETPSAAALKKPAPAICPTARWKRRCIRRFAITARRLERRESALPRDPRNLSANDINNSLKNIADTGGEAGKRSPVATATLLIDEVAPWAARITSSRAPPTSATSAGKRRWPVLQPLLCRGTPLHSWQLVSQGRTSIAHKGMLLAGKVLAATAIRLFSDSALLEASQQELRQVWPNALSLPDPGGGEPSVLR